jgi:stringent starvation protein B
MSNDAITFSAFWWCSKRYLCSYSAVLGIYARENVKGYSLTKANMMRETNNVQTAPSQEVAEPSKKKPSLRILD